MNNDGYDHIKNYVKNSVGDEETQLLISDFAILWNEYEDELYDREHHIRDIPKVISTLNIFKYIERINELYERLIKYIKLRSNLSYDSIVNNYHILIKEPLIKNGEIQFYRNGDIVYTGEIFEDELRKIMKGELLEDKLHFMLLIIARVRNNMFHGRKEIYSLKEQKDLFKVCNETLKLVSDMEKKAFNNY